MDYEKKYKDAIQRAKHALDCDRNNLVSTDVPLIYSMFPELKESEDEKVRKALIEMVHDTTGDGLWVDYNVHKEEALAWLEKQGEQKPVVIPKFKVGDKVRLKGSCGWYNVTEIRGVEYYLTSNDVVPCLLPICEQDDWEVEQKPLPHSENG